MRPEDEAARLLIGDGREPEVATATVVRAVISYAQDPAQAERLARELEATLQRHPQASRLDYLLALAGVAHGFVHHVYCHRAPLGRAELAAAQRVREALEAKPLSQKSTARVLSGMLLAVAQGAQIVAAVRDANEREGEVTQ